MKERNTWLCPIVMCLICVICISCKEKEEPYLNLKPESISLESTGEASEPLVIESNTSWKVTTNESWLKPSMTDGSGNVTIDLKADPNPWERDRKVSIIVTTGEITKNLWITQKHDELAVSGEINLTEEEGASGKFRIEAKREWRVTNVPDWLELSDTLGKGDAEVTVKAIRQNYDGDQRSISLRVTSGALQKYIPVTQSAIGISAPIVLSNGCYFELHLRDAYDGFASILYDASYFDSQSEGSIYSEVKASEKVPFSDWNYNIYPDLPAEKALVICMVPYHRQSGMVTWGDMFTRRIVTASTTASSGVSIGDIIYTNTEWIIRIESEATPYYLIELKNDNAISVFSNRQPDIMYAAFMYLNNIKKNVKGQLTALRSSSDYAWYLIGWGGSSFGNITHKFKYFYGSPQQAAPVTPQAGPKYYMQSNAEFRRLQETLRQSGNVKIHNVVPQKP